MRVDERLETRIRKSTYLGSRRRNGWPNPRELERYFLGLSGQRLTVETGSDKVGLAAEGADGTEDLDPDEGRIDVDLDRWHHPELGVLLIYSKWGGGLKQMYSSRGDVSRLREWVRSKHGTPLPVGLFIPGSTGWDAVKESSIRTASYPRASSGSPTAIFRRVGFHIRDQACFVISRSILPLEPLKRASQASSKVSTWKVPSIRGAPLKSWVLDFSKTVAKLGQPLVGACSSKLAGLNCA